MNDNNVPEVEQISDAVVISPVEEEGKNSLSEMASVEESSQIDNAEKSAEKKSTDKKTDEKEKKTKKDRKKLVSCLLLVILCSMLAMGGIIGGLLLYPKAYNWLKEHNLVRISGNETGTNNQSDYSGMTEEQNVVQVVKNTQSGVVSIAVNVSSITEGEISDTSSNIGSGFIVDKSGIIITNQHVVSDLDSEYKVILTDGTECTVESIFRDDVNDIALLIVKSDNLTALTLGDSDSLETGQTVIAIGTPMGEYAGSVTKGVISGLNRSVTATSGGFWGISKVYENVIQTDAAINPGNSGGPLLNLKGEVIGVNFATTSGADSISFSLPINVVKAKLEEYRKYGRLIKPYIGVQYDIITQDEAKYYKIAAGALVRKVVSGSPADKAGIQRNDIIMSVNGEAIDGSLSLVVSKYKVGEEVKVKIWRNGVEIEKAVTLAEAE